MGKMKKEMTWLQQSITVLTAETSNHMKKCSLKTHNHEYSHTLNWKLDLRDWDKYTTNSHDGGCDGGSNVK